jgi:hypothetical protein
MAYLGLVPSEHSSGAAAGVLAHHRDRWWTAIRVQARDAPGTLGVSENSGISVYL